MRTYGRSGSLCESANGLPPLNCLLVCRSERSILKIAVLKAIRSAAIGPRNRMNKLNTRRTTMVLLALDLANHFPEQFKTFLCSPIAKSAIRIECLWRGARSLNGPTR